VALGSEFAVVVEAMVFLLVMVLLQAVAQPAVKLDVVVNSEQVLHRQILQV
jgi:hypothetical protein